MPKPSKKVSKKSDSRQGKILNNPILYRPIIYQPTIIEEDAEVEAAMSKEEVKNNSDELAAMEEGRARDMRPEPEDVVRIDTEVRKPSLIQRIFGRHPKSAKVSSEEIDRMKRRIRGYDGVPAGTEYDTSEVMQPDLQDGSEAMLGQPTKKAKRVM
jgi:hypothetical protein